MAKITEPAKYLDCLKALAQEHPEVYFSARGVARTVNVGTNSQKIITAEINLEYLVDTGQIEKADVCNSPGELESRRFTIRGYRYNPKSL